MRLVELIAPDRIVLPLQAATLRDATWALVQRIADTRAVDDLAKLRARVAEERGEDIVALGDRAFLSHYRTDAVGEIVIAIGISATPIARDVGESERQQARIVVLIVAPPRLAALHLQVLNAFVRLLADPAVVEALLAAATPIELLSTPALRQVELAPQLTVRELMSERPRTTRPEMPLRDAAREMVRAGIGALPVVDADGLLIGMLSEKELMRHIVNQAVLGGAAHRPAPAAGGRKTVRDAMTRQVMCVSPEQPAAEVAALMTNKDVDRVPVVQEGRLVGFLTRGDIVRKLIGS